MNITLDKIAPPVAYVAIGSIMIFTGGVEVITSGNLLFAIEQPTIRIILIALGIFLVILGSFLAWQEMTISKRSIKGTVSRRPSFDLSGIWSCNDKATYYIRQLGNQVFWLGERTPERPQFCNIAYGTIDSDEVKLDWADIPKGMNRHFGQLVLKVTDNGTHLEAIKRERFGGSSWMRAQE